MCPRNSNFPPSDDLWKILGRKGAGAGHGKKLTNSCWFPADGQANGFRTGAGTVRRDYNFASALRIFTKCPRDVSCDAVRLLRMKHCQKARNIHNECHTVVKMLLLYSAYRPTPGNCPTPISSLPPNSFLVWFYQYFARTMPARRPNALSYLRNHRTTQIFYHIRTPLIFMSQLCLRMTKPTFPSINYIHVFSLYIYLTKNIFFYF